MSQDTSAEDDVSFNSSDVNKMIALSNFLTHKGSPKVFRSKLEIAKLFESFPNKFTNPSGSRVDIPSKSLLNLIDKMMYQGFFKIDDNNQYFFDEDKFDKFIRKEHPDSVEWWKYFDRRVDYFEI